MNARAQLACLVVAAAAAPLGASACELIAGVHDVTFGGTDGGVGIDTDACSPPGPDAGQRAAPLTPIPEGYGPYCSVADPDGGTWGLLWWHDIASIPDSGFPCEIARAELPQAAVARSGLHASDVLVPDAGVAVANNVLARCRGDVTVYNDAGANPMMAANSYAQGAGLRDCVFTVSPVSLPIFSRPFGSPGDVAPVPLAAFDFDLLHAPWDVTAFGQEASPPGTTACGVDRTGRERCHLGTAAECEPADAGCMIAAPGASLGFYYAWGMPEGTPVLAVADGIVRGSRDRAVAGCDVAQKEIFVEHAVGDAEPRAEPYTERFVTGYLGLSSRAVAAGDLVERGQELGRSGSTGCEPVPALRFVVVRLTNLTGASAYPFEPVPDGPYGFNGVQGAIDPFGWSAPEGIDPWGFRFIGAPPPPESPCGYGDPGAFSIDLWLPGEAPPTLH